MESVIIPSLLGALIIAIGIVNMKGNISTIKRYHRHRVTEEDRLPFGRLVGLGNVIIGVSLILFCLLSYISNKLQGNICTIIGSVILIIAVIAGIALNIFAMIKYNKGIF